MADVVGWAGRGKAILRELAGVVGVLGVHADVRNLVAVMAEGWVV